MIMFWSKFSIHFSDCWQFVVVLCNKHVDDHQIMCDNPSPNQHLRYGNCFLLTCDFLIEEDVLILFLGWCLYQFIKDPLLCRVE